jgi:hypothetical protein
VPLTTTTQIIPDWASGFRPGPPDEASQTLLCYCVISNSAPELFAVAPAIDNDGTLTYTPNGDQHGVATLGVVARDTGGTANGGVDTSAVHILTISLSTTLPEQV